MVGEVEPYLYILARSDMVSMNPGKLAAQSAHAANLAQYVVNDLHQHKSDGFKKLWEQWIGDRHFGTTITLDAPLWIINKLLISQGPLDFGHIDGALYGVVTDPTYPVRDGDVTHFIDIPTCAFVFGDKSSFGVQSIVGGLQLYK